MMQVGLRMLNASNIAAPVTMLVRHQDEPIATLASGLVGLWREMAMHVHSRASHTLGETADFALASPRATALGPMT